MNGRTFTFKAKESPGRVAGGASRDFLSVDPEANFSIDGSDVVVIPFTMAFGEVFAREAATPVGR